MLTKNANFWLNIMLIIVFFSLKIKYRSTRICVSEKIGNFNNSLRFRAPFGKILRVVVSKMLLAFYFKFLFLNFRGEIA